MPQLLRRKPEPPLPDAIEIAGGQLPLTVRQNPRAKRMIMRIAPGGGGLIVTVPRGLSAGKIRAFLDRHRGWVEERIARVPDRVAIAPGAVIPLRGVPTLLTHRGGRLVTRLAALAGEAGSFDLGPAELGLPDDEPTDLGSAVVAVGAVGQQLLVGGTPEHFSRRVLDYLRREARRDLEAAVKIHAAAVGLEPRAITIKDTTSRWGSCSSDRRLAFSWRIVMAPPAVLDYLAAHEVAHFREMNHGPEFWALCRKLCPDMDAGKAWLKRHGSGLHAVGVG
ncbi:M48 family metallopeptidase [Aurantimonas sp. 22II-16-19i]|uniref:M48 family metallopeptidase n=1 Tax=Aurantimonas sp. 22II-16-19i TaxID=1317114 RepID=UPI0009F7EC77|nr:M48 family metallopeptidase [Aurantimonas sp. 22II-16-19i]ORE93835.1 zinc metallopeptidase [Aurantimonas sp. 22II-16-19i]